MSTTTRRTKAKPATRANPTTTGTKFYTSGEVARMFSVAPRTVCKWADCGHISAIRLPSTSSSDVADEQHRRFLARPVAEFARKHGLPIPPELMGFISLPSVLLAGGGPNEMPDVPCYMTTRCDTAAAAGSIAAKRIDALVIDLAFGRAECRCVADLARLANPNVLLLLWGADDTRPDDPVLTRSGYTVLPGPVDAGSVLGLLAAHVKAVLA